MDNLVETLEGKTLKMLENMVQSNMNKILFYMAVYIEDMQGTSEAIATVIV